MNSPEILLDLNNLKKNKIKLGRIVKKEFDEVTQVHAKAIESPAPSPSPFTPKFDGPSPVMPKFEPKFEPKLEPKAEPKKDDPAK